MKIFIFSWCVFLLAACHHSKNSNAEEDASLKMQEKGILVDWASGMKIPSDRNIFQDIRILPLQNMEMPLAEISKVVFCRKKYFISDKKLDVLQVYDSAGRYLYQIGRDGVGPEEHRGISDFDVDCEKGTVVVHSGGTRMLLQYELSGKFISQKKMPVGVSSFVLCKNGSMVVYPGQSVGTDIREMLDNKSLFLLDQNLGIEASFMSRRPIDETYPESTFLMRNRDDILFSNLFSDTIHSVQESGAPVIKYAVRFGDQALSTEIRNNWHKFKTESFREGNKYAYLRRFFAVNENDLVFSFIDKKRLEWAVYNIESRQIWQGSHENIIYELLLYNPVLTVREDNTFVGVLSPANLIEMIDYHPEFQRDSTSFGEEALLLYKKIQAGEFDKPSLVEFKINPEVWKEKLRPRH